MARWDEQVSQDQAADLPTVLEIARASGARYAVVGSAVAIGPAVRLVADIYGAEDGERLGRGQVEGAPDSVLMLIDRLAVEAVRIVPRTSQCCA